MFILGSRHLKSTNKWLCVRAEAHLEKMGCASCFASEWGCCFSGFLRSDTLLGTVTVKLQPLETQCEIHDSFDVSYFIFCFSVD